MRPDAAPDELDDDGVGRLWAAVWIRARRDARGVGAAEGERRDARRWFESGAALDLLLALGIHPKRAERLVACELQVMNNGQGKAR